MCHKRHEYNFCRDLNITPQNVRVASRFSCPGSVIFPAIPLATTPQHDRGAHRLKKVDFFT